MQILFMIKALIRYFIEVGEELVYMIVVYIEEKYIKTLNGLKLFFFKDSNFRITLE